MEAFLPLTWSAALRSTAMVTALAMMAVPAPALAQQRYQAGPPQMTTLAKEHGKGTVAKVAPGLLMLKLQNIMWAALPAPGAAIEVTGSASREMLQPKQFVSCNVTLDGLGKPAGAAEMVVLTDGGVPGVMAAGVSDMLQQRRGPRPAGSYTVSGPIQMVDGDMVTVMVGRERFEIMVPEETELVVRSQNVTLASEGDEVEVEGKYFQVGQLMVTSLKIKMTKPLVPPPPKGRRPAAGN